MNRLTSALLTALVAALLVLGLAFSCARFDYCKANGLSTEFCMTQVVR